MRSCGHYRRAQSQMNASHHRSPGGDREVWKEEVLDDLPEKDEKGSSVRRKLELFLRSNVGEGSERRGERICGFMSA